MPAKNRAKLSLNGDFLEKWRGGCREAQRFRLRIATHGFLVGNFYAIRFRTDLGESTRTAGDAHGSRPEVSASWRVRRTIHA
jgi:hypothetical protein